MSTSQAPPTTDPNPDHAYSSALDLDAYDTHGFTHNYALRNHHSQAIAIIGTDALRSDWRQHVGPVTKYGCHNPINGHCCALMWPLAKPERLWLIAYIIEYVFLYDHVLESSEKPELSDAATSLVVEQTAHLSQDAVGGTKVLQRKIVSMLNDIDAVCAKAVEREWRRMVEATTSLDKSEGCKNLEEYVDFRVVDAGGPFCLALMCWGMGLVLTPTDEETVQLAAKLAYAAIVLANDVVSFDQEIVDLETMGVDSIANAVFYHMRWNHLDDVDEAKRYVTDKTIEYEVKFLQVRDELLANETLATPNVRRYLEGLELHGSGYIVWHLNCPRYHKEFRGGLKGYLDIDPDEQAPTNKEQAAP